MEPMLLLIALTLAGSVGLLTFLTYQWLVDRRRTMAARVGIGGADAGLSLVSPLHQRRRSFPLSNLLPFSRRSGERMSLELERAGWPLRVGEYLSLRLASAVIGGVAGLVLVTSLHLPDLLRVPIIVSLVLVGWFFPRLRLSSARGKRLARIEKQLPDTLLAMASALRAGTGLLQALSSAANETPAPLGAELQRTIRELHMGAEAEEVFSALAERIDSRDVDIVVSAIVIQRTSGGNLSDILVTVTNTIRERNQIREEINTLTASERLTANLMALVPVLVVVFFIFMNPVYADRLFHTTIGQFALAIGIALEVLGYWMIRRLVRIEV